MAGFCNLYIVKLAFAGSGVPASSSCETFTTSSCRKETQEKTHPHIFFIYIYIFYIKPNKLFFWLISFFFVFLVKAVSFRFFALFSLFFVFFSVFFSRFWFLCFSFSCFFGGWGWCSTAVGDLETSGRPEIWPLQLMCFRNYESRTFRIFSACSTAVGDLETSGRPEMWPLQLMCFRNCESRTFRRVRQQSAWRQVADQKFSHCS